MPYHRPQLTLAAPTVIARQAEPPPVEGQAQPPEPHPSRQPIDIADLADRVYRLMLQDVIIERERRARF